MRRDYKENKEDKEPKLSIMEKEALRPEALRITGLQAPSRQLMSESGRMRLEARKLRRAGDKQGYYDLMRRAAMEKIAGEPTVKSQAFVDAQERAKKTQPDLMQRTQDMINELMRNRRKPEIYGITNSDNPPMMTSDFRVSETGSGLDARLDPNSVSYWRRGK
jgi:hypothetical protein